MKIEELVPIEYREQRVLTGRQVAELYGVKPDRIHDNFRKSKKHFKEGEHYFKVGGEELRKMKEEVAATVFAKTKTPESFLSLRGYVSPLGSVCNTVILYTAQGCARHCKMLNTETAWKVFGELEKAYFGQEEIATPAPMENEAEVAKLRKEIILLKKQLPRAQSLDLAVVYVLLMSNGSIKIGLTGNLPERIKQIKQETGLEVYNYATTKYVSREEARQIEQVLLEKFAAYNLGGEFFSVNFAQASLELS